MIERICIVMDELPTSQRSWRCRQRSRATGPRTALAACTGLKWFGVRLDPEVYYIDRLPVNVDIKDYGLVALAAMIICTLSTLYPALAASKLSPVDGLRHE